MVSCEGSCKCYSTEAVCVKVLQHSFARKQAQAVPHSVLNLSSQAQPNPIRLTQVVIYEVKQICMQAQGGKYWASALMCIWTSAAQHHAPALQARGN